jgi:hypothetical protein
MYRPQQKSLGSKEYYKNRFFDLYDSEGNVLPITTPLEVGQIVNRERGNTLRFLKTEKTL